MKKIYISSPQKYVDDLFTFNLKSELSLMGYEVINKDFGFNSIISEKEISSEYLLSQADIFIAILKEKNPQVFYELGYATALGKKVLIISEPNFEIPESLRNYEFINFDYEFSNNAYFNILNFLEKTKIEEKGKSEDIQTLKEFVLRIKENSQIIDRISSPKFEELIAQYFLEIGATVESTTSSSDYGYDLILHNWKGNKKTIVEAKKYNKNSKVSVTVIQQIIGAMNVYDADYAIIITTSEFTSSAKEFVSSYEKKIELWDINVLVDKIS